MRNEKAATLRQSFDRDPQARPVGLAACFAGSQPTSNNNKQTKQHKDMNQNMQTTTECEMETPKRENKALTAIHKLGQ